MQFAWWFSNDDQKHVLILLCTIKNQPSGFNPVQKNMRKSNWESFPKDLGKKSKNIWNHHLSHEKKKNSYFPLYWLFNREPYSGPYYNCVLCHPQYTLNN